jgi:hypothetical protein
MDGAATAAALEEDKMTTTQAARRATSTKGPGKAWGRRLAMTSLVAAAGAVVVWAVAEAAGVDLAVHSGADIRPVGLGSVIAVSLLAALAGGLTHRLATRWARGARVWTCVAAAVLVVSLSGPASATTLAGGAALAAMHLLVGLTVILRQPRRATRGVA